MQTQSYEISYMSMHSVVRLNFTYSMCLCNDISKWLKTKSCKVTFIDVNGCFESKSKRILYMLVDVCFIFYRTNKRHIYATPLRSSYFVSLHSKDHKSICADK